MKTDADESDNQWVRIRKW